MILSDTIAPKIGSAEGEALCRGSGCPRKFPLSFLPPQAEVNENEKGLYFLLKKGQTSYEDLRTMRE